MPYIEEVKQSVAFLYGTSVRGEGPHKSVPQGTCFFVSPPSAANEEGLYLVTAKHVYDDLTETTDPLVRVNKTGGGSTSIPLKLGEDEWLFHEDEGVDLAVQLWGPHRWGDRQVDIFSWSLHGMPAAPYPDFHEGSDVIFTGLMLGFPGQDKNLVTVRDGTIALLTEEKIATRRYGEAEYIVINAQCYHGNSGSPVFAGGAHAGFLIFIGVLTYGFADEAERFSTAQRDQVYYNHGVSLVTPAVKLEEIMKKDTKKRRQASRQLMLTPGEPTLE